MTKRFFTWLLLFLGLSLILQSFQGNGEESAVIHDVLVAATDNHYSVSETPMVVITNALDQAIEVATDCPQEPLTVEYYSNGVWNQMSSAKGLHVLCDDKRPEGTSQLEFLQPPQYEIAAGESVTLDYAPWKTELFSELGKYRITLNLTIDGQDREYFTEFDISDRGFLSSVGYHFFYRPIYNLMLFLISVLPGQNFGLAIIVLTIVIRLILLVPNQKALKSQRAMTQIQPKLEEIRKKYAGNQEMISQETLKLWKQNNVNPVGGCLPLLIQLPILISLFYVIKAGFTPYQGDMVYDFLQSVDLFTVDTNFYGILDLQKVNFTWLPLLVGLFQFFQLRLSFARKARTESHKNEVVDVDEKGKVSNKPAADTNPMQMMSKSMMYFMPVMMALMAASLPSGVGLYLMISTLFGIGQQYTVNKSIG